MTQPAIERFKARRAIQAKQATRPRLAIVTISTECAAPRKRVIDRERIDAMRAVNGLKWDRNISPDDITARIAELAARVDSERDEAMWHNCHRDVLRSIAGPFGVGKIVSALDKTGGNVDTVSNVRGGVYATENERNKYEDRGEYNSTDYHTHENYKATCARNLTVLKGGKLVDAYTGEPFHLRDKENPQTKPVTDHIVAAKSVHDDPGRVLAGLEGIDLANKDSNLATTGASINASKSAKPAKEYLQYLEKGKCLRRERIREIEAKGVALTDQERKQLAKHRELEMVDSKRLIQKDEAARMEMNKEINRKYYASIKFTGGLARTGVTEGVKMGV